METAAGILRKARQCCPNACLRPRAFNNDSEEDFDCEKLIKFLSKELFPLIDGSLNDWVRVILKRNCRAVGLKEVLIDVKAGPEDLERSLKALHGIFLRCLVKALVVHAL